MKQTSSLGLRLRALRKERHLTQRQLANQAGISVNAVSLIERSEISPSVSTLQSLATALRVKLSYFFDEDEQARIIFSKAGDRPALTSEGVTITGLGQKLSQQQIDLFLVSLEPHAECGKQFVIHPGHELVYCLRGTVVYEVDDQKYLLEEGDMLLFEATLSHRWENPAAESAEMLLILQAADGTPEITRRHFPDYPSLTHIG